MLVQLATIKSVDFEKYWMFGESGRINPKKLKVTINYRQNFSKT